jgi:hypothetical protein
MNTSRIAALVVSSSLVVAAQAVTIATHADPSPTGTPSVFTVDTVANTVSASWMGAGLNLELPFLPMTSANLKLSMVPVTITSTVVVGPLTIRNLGAGEIRYYDTDINNPIFQINFDSAQVVEPAAASAADLTGNNVSFSGSALVGQVLTNESMAYSFSNREVSGTNVNYTAAFTSSADVVPEPATMIAVGGAIAAFMVRRKRS